MPAKDAFLFCNVTGAGYLDDFVFQFSPKGLMKLFYKFGVLENRAKIDIDQELWNKMKQNMSLLEQKKDFSKRGAFDELYTPSEAVEMILPYIPKEVKTIWECTAIKESKIVKVLRDAGYNVITTHIEDGQDFFKYEPENYDMIVTNPPYSLKDKFLKRAYDLKKPFMFLLPLTTLEGIERGKMFNKNGIQMLIPNKRFNFKPEKNSGAWFQTSWFCFGCRLGSDLNFVSLK
jgi:hypothetical protein